eukprot:TRINITY_DN11262_c1_g1_i1.p1 TRINITY_DN11262_c1_g1~~TRINITY_DN11262_c1_g1_i1.p1  ORF type:complete len:486 (-),score=16.27 TRINITY_DN11262_c1_g1_i1:78-1535(-)
MALFPKLWQMLRMAAKSRQRIRASRFQIVLVLFFFGIVFKMLARKPRIIGEQCFKVPGPDFKYDGYKDAPASCHSDEFYDQSQTHDGPSRVYTTRDPQELLREHPALAEYVRFHQESIRRIKAGGDVGGIGFVEHYQPVNKNGGHDVGQGNIWLKFVSAFVVAFLSNRVFLMPTNSLLSPLVAHPLLDWDSAVLDLVPGVRSSVPPLFDCCRYDEIGQDFVNQLYCSTLDETFTDRIVRLSGGQNYGAILGANSHYRNRLVKHFGTSWFSVLGRFLIQPSPAVRTIVDDFKSSVLAGAPYIGLQIRTNLQGEFDAGYVPSANEIRSFWRCAQLASPTSAANVKFYVATDTTSVFTFASRILCDKVFSLEGANITTYSRRSARGVLSAFAEIVLLAEADQVVMTAYSTYGYIAAMLNGQRPFVVLPGGSCLQELTDMPCAHLCRMVADTACYEPERIYPENANFLNCSGQEAAVRHFPFAIMREFR